MENCNILIGVTGGIAAFKTAQLVSQLVQSGFGVDVILTRAASQFVGPTTFAALSGRRVCHDSFDPDHHPLGAHIELARRCQLMCIAPASADFLAKAASGLADDLLSTTYLCFSGPVLVAPSMNNEMWESPAVQRNVAQLQADGIQIIQPTEGWLSCRVEAKGRMAEPDQILAMIQHCVQAARRQ